MDSNANLPVLPGTLDRLLCLFGFPMVAEFARVLKPSGLLVQVDSGPNHLREITSPSLKPERPPDLLAMTPHLYRAKAEGRAVAAALTELSSSVDVRLTCFDWDMG